MINILFFGDIVGKIGRQTIIKLLPKIKKEFNPDFVIANAENAAHGAGINEKIIKELMSAGIDAFTTGDHAFDNKKQLTIYDKYPIIRPANFSQKSPGKGWLLLKSKSNKQIIIINLIGRIFMRLSHECPFLKLDEILAINNLSAQKNSAILIDIHAEATSEKINLFHYANSRVSAILGTHTHIMTADEQITTKGTAYITDVGMCGAADESLGISKKGTLKTFLTQIKEPHAIPKKGKAMVNAVFVSIRTNGTAKKIKTIKKFIYIS